MIRVSAAGTEPGVSAEETVREDLTGETTEEAEEERGTVETTAEADEEQGTVETTAEADEEQGTEGTDETKETEETQEPQTDLPSILPSEEQQGETLRMVLQVSPWILAGIVCVLAAGILLWYILRHSKAGKEEIKVKTEAQTKQTGQESGEDEPQTAKESPVRIASVHNVGNRESQQDSFGVSEWKNPKLFREKGILAVVADGMGGLEDGAEISSRAVVAMMQYFHAKPVTGTMSQFLLYMLQAAVEQVNRYLGSAGIGRGGTTLVAVVVRDRYFDWISVGDSRIYLYRNETLMQVNSEHVYAVELDEKAARGEISLQQAMSDPQREALTSYVGMGDLKQISRNIRSMRLQKGDRILLMSDGIYKTLSDQEISDAMKKPLQESAADLNQGICQYRKSHQDNYTAVILEYLG